MIHEPCIDIVTDYDIIAWMLLITHVGHCKTIFAFETSWIIMMNQAHSFGLTRLQMLDLINM